MYQKFNIDFVQENSTSGQYDEILQIICTDSDIICEAHVTCIIYFYMFLLSLALVIF